jgi:cellulose synthase/poly-beta-1,6-N-acetylglucosamine synthase-like glycosyltransferase
MNDTLPFVSVIIPCRNEEAFIGTCLDSLLANDYPKDRFEIFVVDGESSDGTVRVVEGYTTRSPSVKVLTNPKRITPVAMNIGVRNARGEIVTKTDAHSVYAPDYISKCVRYLLDERADLVGGTARATPSRNTREARAIALTLSSSFGVGGASFRKGAGKPQEADTVFGGFYRKEIFEKVGFFNEHLARSQDMELNLRIKRAGGKIILVPNLEISYYPKPTLREFFLHNVADGIWAVLPMKYGASLFKLRHLAPLFFVGGTAVGLALGIFSPILALPTALTLAFYLLVSLFFSSSIAMRERDALLVPFLMLAFGARHFGYGIGSLIGLVKLLL